MSLTVECEVASGLGSAKIVLCGHGCIPQSKIYIFLKLIGLFSMGGLLAADSLREFVKTRPDKAIPLWPKIVACIAYDTPVRESFDRILHMLKILSSVLWSEPFCCQKYETRRIRRSGDHDRVCTSWLLRRLHCTNGHQRDCSTTRGCFFTVLG